MIKGYNIKYKSKNLRIKEIDHVRNVKQIILNMFSIDSKYFYLTYKGKILNENMTLGYYNISIDCNLYFHCRF